MQADFIMALDLEIQVHLNIHPDKQGQRENKSSMTQNLPSQKFLAINSKRMQYFRYGLKNAHP